MALPLHVANGQSTRSKLRDGGVVGEIVSHDDVLVDGPLPADAIAPASPAWSARAAWMAREHGADAGTYLRDVAALAAAMGAHDGAVVLWSDAGCAHCAANLVWLLALPAPQQAGARRMLVRPDGARLGERAPHDLAGLVPVAVTAAQLAWATEAWAAIVAGPAALGGFLLRRTPDWPELARDLHPLMDHPRLLEEAIARWLEWQPLGVPEMMERLARDPKVKGLGLGDASLAVRLRAMEAAGKVARAGELWRMAA